ncbi:MAG: hypothetical protein AB7F96_04325 [Beijerinckiaceae bacterium]
MRDSKSNLKFMSVIPPAVVSDDTAKVGAIIDRQGFESLTYMIATGTLADADATFTVLLEEGNQSDLSDASAVADGDLIGTEADASFNFGDDDVVRSLGYIGSKRYTRLTITPSGNGAAAPVSAAAVLSGAHSLPVA